MIARIPNEALIVLDSLLGSFDKLELVWCLTRTSAPVPRGELQVALQLDDDSLRAVLADLRAAKIVEVSGALAPKVRLGPRAQRDDFRSLMAMYAEDREVVLAALSSISIHRVRIMAARTRTLLKKSGGGNHG